MSAKQITKAQLQRELDESRQRVAELQACETLLTDYRSLNRKLFEASTDAIFLENLEGKIFDCNQAACKMYGYTRRELLQLSVTDLVPPEFLTQVPELTLQHQTTGGVFIKALNVRKNGQPFPVEVSTQVINTAEGSRVLVYVRDITAQEVAAQSLEQRMQEIIAIYETSLEISAQSNLAVLLPAIIERTVNLIGAPMGGLYLMQPDGQSLRLAISHHLPRDYTGVTLRLGEGLSGRVAQTGQLMTIEDYHAWEGRAEIYSDTPFRYVLAIPLKIENRVIGVLNVADIQFREPFSEQQVQLITLFANQAAVAIHNAQLLEALRRELAVRQRAEKVQAALYRISEATQTAQDLSQLFGLIHATIKELMPARNFYIALYDSSADLITFPYYTDEFDPPPPPTRPARGLTEYVLRSGQPLLATPEVYQQLLDSGEVESVGAPSVDWLGVPLKTHQESIGMMAVQTYTSEERYSLADQDVLAFVSTQAAMAIERKAAEQALRRSEERYRLLFEKATVGIVLINPQGAILEVNPTALQILGSPSAEATKSINILTFPPLIKVGFSDAVQQCLKTGQPIIADCPYTSLWEKSVHVQYHLSPISDEEGNVALVQTILEDITERVLAEQEIRRLNLDLRHHAEELSILHQAGQVMTSTLDLEHLYNLIVEQTLRLLGVEAALLLMSKPSPAAGEPGTEQLEDFTVAAECGLGVKTTAMKHALPPNSIAAWVIHNKQSTLVLDAHNDPRFYPQADEEIKTAIQSLLLVPLLSQGKLIGVVGAINKSSAPFNERDQALLESLCSSAAIALENARLLAETQRRAEQLRMLYDAGITLNRTLDSRLQIETLSQIAMQTLHAEHCEFFRYDPTQDEINYEFGTGRSAHLPGLQKLHRRLGEQNGLIGWIAQHRKPFYLPDTTLDPRWIPIDPEIRSVYWVPIEHDERLLGLLSVATTRPDAFSPDDQRLLILFANQVAVALDNAQLYREALDATERRTALHWLSQQIIRNAFEPEQIYQAIYQAALKLMPADAFIIALVDEPGDAINLVYCIDRGQRYTGLHVEHGHSLSGYIIQSGESLIIDQADLPQIGVDALHFGDDASVHSILAVPMRISERVIGMISSQSYQTHAYSSEDANLLEILASNAAIALENARIFAQMQAANLELVRAYEATIEGWSRALEMRDKETKGHSDRVTRMTLRLAIEIGMSEEELVHLRRGVLLHDIGKMAVPDHILLKPSTLSEDEWQIMRQHPMLAQQMLSGIEFLQPSLDIPYCHHEKWDGSGYPRGVKGQEIPLAARIFSVVDVWDALSSDRPYRPAWTPAAVRTYILEQSSTRFDPEIVATFIKLLDAGEFIDEQVARALHL
ncbi:MAG: GAF domain-containing protein [Anaerolineales bacterium]|nr:GAF domain-containing protein [Anaerolineales bacterium]